MFCPKCGKELPDDSLFCLKCGQTLNASARTQPNRSRTGLWILLAIIAVVAFWAVSFLTSHAGNGTGVSALPHIIAIPHTQEITSSATTVAALGSTFYKFVVPPDATNVSAEGHFGATGGLGNDIIVCVLNDDQFVNFKNGHSTPTYFNSGKITEGSINAVLPGGGTCYLVLDNKFSLLTPEAVQISATLHYTD